ncbi:HAMP domain-containing protein [Nostoc sp. FACHB-152]|uniref:ATP-binding protein n=1 Tax=unclassified Nostoc TaxID=2593658 RepID=UPI0016873A87|nr:MULTISPECIES: ATP-binding protein [unclassified Nostoc]MBD2445754.1 HAMP domain-containing protein [Nostoc sp. FACHB-152]MBD2466868.1 HAMP domain-containing protein [Nostoc sp. FACHB-145]
MKNTDVRYSYKLPLRLFLIVPFVIQIFGAVGLVGYFSFKNGQKAVSSLVGEVMRRSSGAVTQHLDSYLATPHQINQINADIIQQKRLDLQDLKSSGYYFWKQAQTFKNISWIGYVLPTGKGAGAGRLKEGQDALINESYAQKDFTYATDNQGNRTQLLYSTNYNPLTDTWYADTVKAGKPIWSRIYPSEGFASEGLNFDGYVAASANYPIYDRNQKLVAVIGVDLLLSNISDFLRNLNISPNDKIFIIERNGLLIANSLGQPNFQTVKEEIKRLKDTEIQDPLIKATANYLKQKFRNYQTISKHEELEFEFAGKRYFIHVTNWRDHFSLDWIVVVLLPESDFMEQIDANNQTTILLCGLALGAATLLGMYTSRWISKPILILSKASKAIASGDLNQQVPANKVAELDMLASSFNKMAAQLISAFKILEQNNVELENRVEERTAELKQVITELQQTQAQLIQTEKMSSLGMMVAGIAHEINNPVSFIHGNITYARRYVEDLFKLINEYQKYYSNPSPEITKIINDIELDFLTSDLTKILGSMESGTQRITDIVISLKNFARLDEAEFKAVNIHEGLESTLMILDHRLKGIESNFKITVVKEYEDLPIIECHPSQINQAFMNIIANAIDALEEKSRSVTSEQGFPYSNFKYENLNSKSPMILIKTQLINEKNATITIADNALGMTDTVASKLFDPFFTTKSIGKGTGLGLYISYKIVVEKHKGNLTVNSLPGQGSEFVITIPIN